MTQQNEPSVINHNEIKLCGEPDRIFAEGPYPKPFEFNSDVVRVFDDMVSRSVPMYREVNQSIVEWCYYYYQTGSRIYDIGCSTGTTIETLGHHLPKNSTFIGIDNSQPMLNKAKEKLTETSKKHAVKLLCQDAQTIHVEDASVAILNYTLQFIPVNQRLPLLKNIFDGLRPGGILFLSEKVSGNCPEIQETFLHIYENFKANAGYSRSEIELKKEALDNVLVPLTFDGQVDMLKNAGFTNCEPVIKWNNFVSIVAIKPHG